MIELSQLQQRQKLSLGIKEQFTANLIQQWYEFWDGNIYVSFSGGKDSTVLLHQVRKLYPEVPAIFSDTGLEYPEIRNFVKTIDNVFWLKPKIYFNHVIEHHGYPVISKEVSRKVRDLRRPNCSDKLKNYYLFGNDKGQGILSKKWRFLINAPFKISEYCCNVLKKNPFHNYESKTKRKHLIGNMVHESRLRWMAYRKTGCNAFNARRPLSIPMSFWLEQDVWDYIHKYNLKYSSIYDIGYSRTGCMFCMFGVHKESEPNRFQLMKKTHPEHYEYCIEKLGLWEVLDFINVSY